MEGEAMTYRERREARTERLREWAEKREAKSEAAFGRAEQISSVIPMGQPILVGHHSEGRHRRDIGRIESGMRKGVEHSKMAQRHSERAGNIEGQLERSIYSDDPDAIEALEARIESLEAERSRVKAYNVSCRKGKPDTSLLDESQRKQLAGLLKIGSVFIGKGGQFPSYHLQNLGGNINRNKKRLASLKRVSA
jgi:hypothetical protein